MNIRNKKDVYSIVGIILVAMITTIVIQAYSIFGKVDLSTCYKYIFRSKYSNQLDYKQEYINDNLKDIEIDGEIYASTSNDPWILLGDINEPVFSINIYMKQVSEGMTCTIYYTDAKGEFSEEKTVSSELRKGKNIMYIPSTRIITKLRVDITNHADDMFNVEAIRINDKETIGTYEWDKMCLVFLMMLVICILMLYLIRRKDVYNSILLVSGVMIVLYNISRIQSIGSIRNKIILIIFNGILFLGVGYLIKNTKNIIKQFIVIVALIGISFSIIVPPMQAPDEDVHWLRSYYLATGHISLPSNLNNIPISFDEYFRGIGSFDMPFNYNTKVNKEEFKEMLTQPLDKQETMSYSKGSRTDSYLIFAYLPQSIGMAIGNILSLPPFWILLLGRITNLVVWCTICSVALYIMPIKKQLLLAIILMPMSVFQAASLSPDAVLNASSFLLIAYILNLKYREDTIKVKDYIILIVCSIGIVSVKNPYLILLGLMLVIPKEKFNNNTKYQGIIKIMSIIGIGLIGLILYGVIKLTTIEIVPVDGNTVGVLDVVKDTMINFNVFIKLVLNDLNENLKYYYQSMVARFGWLDTPMPLYIIRIYAISVILIAIIHDGTENKLEVKNKIWMLCLFSGFTVMLIMVGVLWAETDWKTLTSVSGIQGRYFVPFIILIPLILYNIRVIRFSNKLKGFLTHNVYINVLAMILILSIDCIIYRYWIG